MPRYGMVIDLDRCIGCHACTVACRAEHATPPGVRFTKVVQVDEGLYPHVRRSFIPRGCMHCAEPPCVDVCPTGASYKRADGVVLVSPKRCIGCKACVLACPYEARFFLDDLPTYFPSALTLYERSRSVSAHVRGTVEKCTFCIDRLDAGLQPACVETCPTKARTFGDLDDPESEVARLAQDRRAAQPSPEWATRPSVFYLLPYVRGHEPAGDPAAAAQAAAGADAPAAAPRHEVGAFTSAQSAWGWRVALYLGLSSAGAAAFLFWQLGALARPAWAAAARPGAALGIALVLVGALLILADLGRPERFYLAVLRPRTSWESRGTLIVGAFGVLGLLHVASWLVAGGGWDGLLAAPLALLALAILVYGGLLLRSLRAFALWTASWQVGLYVVSGLLAGGGVLALDAAGSLSAAQARALAQGGGLLAALAALLLAGLLAWAHGHGTTSRAAAQELLAGPLAGHLWVGVVGIGLALPLLAGVVAALGPLPPLLGRLAGAAALAGVLILRFAILAAARRPTELTFRGLGPWAAAAAGR